jgi:hypothetical protein
VDAVGPAEAVGDGGGVGAGLITVGGDGRSQPTPIPTAARLSRVSTHRQVGEVVQGQRFALTGRQPAERAEQLQPRVHRSGFGQLVGIVGRGRHPCGRPPAG